MSRGSKKTASVLLKPRATAGPCRARAPPMWQLDGNDLRSTAKRNGLDAACRRVAPKHHTKLTSRRPRRDFPTW